MAADEVLAQFATGPEGLTAEEAKRRRAAYGPNRLPEAATRGLLPPPAAKPSAWFGCE